MAVDLLRGQLRALSKLIQRGTAMIPISSSRAMEKQIDQLQNVVNAIFLAFSAVILAASTAEKEVSFLDLKLATSGAYSLLALVFFFAILTIVQLFARVADIVMLADAQEAPKVLAALFNHGWPLNPFSHFGSHPIAMLHDSLGMGLLTFVWWLGLIALEELWAHMSHESPEVAWERGLWYAYVVVGFVALAGMLNVHRSVRAKLAPAARASDDADLEIVRQALNRVFAIKYASAVVFSAFGYYIFYQLTHIG